MANTSAKPRRPPWPRAPIGTLGTLALAFGAGVLGYYMLDGHSHTCDSCNHRWHHLGAFNFGDPVAHTCTKCGTVQIWKDGARHVFRQILRTPPPDDYVAKMRQLAESSPALLGGSGGSASSLFGRVAPLLLGGSR